MHSYSHSNWFGGITRHSNRRKDWSQSLQEQNLLLRRWSSLPAAAALEIQPFPRATVDLNRAGAVSGQFLQKFQRRKPGWKTASAAPRRAADEAGQCNPDNLGCSKYVPSGSGYEIVLEPERGSYKKQLGHRTRLSRTIKLTDQLRISWDQTLALKLALLQWSFLQ